MTGIKKYLEKARNIWTKEGPSGAWKRVTFFTSLLNYKIQLKVSTTLKKKRQRANDAKAFEEIKDIAIHTINSRHKEIARVLSEACYYVYNTGIEGDIAEFGTCSARSAVAIAACAHELNNKYRSRDEFRKPKHVHFFDSFEGLPTAIHSVDKNLAIVKEGIWAKGSCKDYTSEDFRKTILKYLRGSEFNVHEGWFKDTIKTLPNNLKFSLIHIDGDLYESAIDVLDGLFSRRMISAGCIIAFDDWLATKYNEGEQLAFSQVCKKYSINFSDEGAYGATCRKFRINQYKSAGVVDKL